MDDLIIGYYNEEGVLCKVFKKSPEQTFICSKCGQKKTSGVAKSTAKKKRVCYDCVDLRRKEYNRARSRRKYHETNAQYQTI